MISESPLIVIGMHRSGTSFATSWLHSMGMNLGDDLIGSGLGNVKGHFEDREFHDNHEWVFKNHRIKYGALRFPVDFDLSSEERTRLSGTIIKKNNENKQWGWKDPRTCLFLDFYHKILPKAKYFILYRPCNEVVDSLLRRQILRKDRKYLKKSKLHRLKYKLVKKIYHKNIRKLNTETYIRIWVYYNNKIMELINNIDPSDYVICDQESLLRSGKQNFNQLLVWGFKLKYISIYSLFNKDLFKHGHVENYTKSNYSEADFLNRFFQDRIRGNKGMLSSKTSTNPSTI